ncbi:hypothetical protein M406DRAFT_71339 [Cryphonectria parasitica EP155]|uniref:Uncharacterized protein n=1 Tax=Cryphonectria parasitica (strain ATCC 38755 / EP155) TaxID=660469 RepID=A0A9P4Y042_CRYP1|nr:uncharacterized protein M406DRAFT_71339 [Cryphonectria parasitica EP155]KAF3764096.1 hypothetical protein M406DRAFT_71339 [Cryphonectria parasitica EP155]
MRFYIALVAAFAGVSFADMHYSCTCHNGDSYNWRITSPACSFYAPDRPADVSYVTDTGRCTSASGSQIDGDSWQAACQKIATEGFDCADGQGKCYAESSDVTGSCD